MDFVEDYYVMKFLKAKEIMLAFFKYLTEPSFSYD